MKKALRSTVFSTHSPNNPPQLTVSPGEIFLVETELCTGPWLNSIEDDWTPEKTKGCNPATVVAVEGAKVGDILAVEILDIIPDKVGYSKFNAKSNALADKILPRGEAWGSPGKTVSIEGGFVHWSEKIKLPIAPMIGTIGTAPALETLSNARAHANGGNMDIQEVRPGTTVYLPIDVPEALLHVGDAHAIQGDGEINCSGGIECRSEAKLRVNILPRSENYNCVRMEDEKYIMTVGSEKSLEGSFYAAAKSMVLWLTEYGLTIEEAYLRMGFVMEARNTQFVNPTWSYICKMPKEFI